MFPNFENCARCEKDLKDNKDNGLHLGRKYARIFVLGHYLFLVAHSFLELRSRKTVRFSEQIMSADKYPCIFSRQMAAIVYIFHTYWYFRIKFCFVKKRFGFYFDQSERRNEFLAREKIVSSNHKPRFKRLVFSRAFSRSSRVALSGSFDKILYFRCTRVVRNSNFQVIKSYRRYFWGWLNNQEDFCL